jgi:VWFA-related protein
MNHLRRVPFGVAALATLCAALVTTTSAKQVPTFTSGVQMVRVDVLATVNGRPMAGLTASDFEVTDNGVTQQVALVEGGSLPLDVVLLFDMSHSVRGAVLESVRAAARASVGTLESRDRVALVAAGASVHLKSGFSLDRLSVVNALDALPSQGNTALIDGMAAALALANTATQRPLILAFSDGEDTSSFLPAESVAYAARGSSAVVYGVVTRTAERSFLENVAGQTAGRLIRLTAIDELERAFGDVFREFRQRYMVGFVPAGVPQAGWHRLQIKVRRPGVQVTARPGYFARRK